ncbi:hypothetical protein U1Q18_031370 [Sarracenia purpurea var. burkii]
MVETRLSCSSRRSLYSPSSFPIPNGKKSKAVEAASSTSEITRAPPEETLSPTKELGYETRSQESQSCAPPSNGGLKPADKLDTAMPEKASDVLMKGEPLAFPASSDAKKMKVVVSALVGTKEWQSKPKCQGYMREASLSMLSDISG